jgi:uncharacterized delta-60 repeat protein
MKCRFATLAMSLALPLSAGATQLDPTFGYTGTAVYGFDQVANGYDPVGGAAVDASGRVWVAGGVQIASNGPHRYRWGTLWLTPHGYPDFNLAQDGAYVYPMPQPWEQNNARVKAATFDAQGRFVVAMLTQPDSSMQEDVHVHVCRMTAVGSYDTSFGINGCTKVLFDVNSTFEVPYQVRVQADGHILVSGGSRIPNGNVQRAAVARLDDHGSYDANYGPLAPNGGSRILSWPATSGSGVAEGLLATADGGCLVLSTVGRNAAPGIGFGLAKLTANGALDASFSQDGYLLPLFATANQTPLPSTATELLQLPGGDFLVGGFSPYQAAYSPAGLMRITPSGELNINFGNNGSLVFTFNDVAITSKISGLALDPAGRIVVAGNATRDLGNNQQEDAVGVGRLSALGVFDSSFGVDGLYNFEVEPYATDAKASDFVGDVIVRGDVIYIAGSTFPKGPGITDSNYFVSKIDDGLIFDDGFDD